MISLKKLIIIIVVVIFVLAFAMYEVMFYNFQNTKYWGNSPQQPYVPINNSIVNLSTVEKIYNNYDIKNGTYKVYNVSTSNYLKMYFEQTYFYPYKSFLEVYYQEMDSPSQAYFPFIHTILPNSTYGNYKVFQYREANLPHFHEAIIFIYYYNYFINITGTYYFENVSELQQVAFAQMDLMLS